MIHKIKKSDKYLKRQSSSAIVMPPIIRNLQTGEEFVDIIPDQTTDFFLGISL